MAAGSRICVAIIILISFILTTIAAFSCEFVHISMTADLWGSSYSGRVHVGFIGVQTGSYTSCSSVSWNTDSAWKAGMAFALIAFIFALGNLVPAVLAICMPVQGKIYGCIACTSLFIVLCEGLSLIALASGTLSGVSTNGVNVDSGAGCAIAAMFTWLIVAVLSVKESKVEDDDGDDNNAAAREPLVSDEPEENA